MCVLVCLLTSTFERLLTGRWSVFWPSYLCFVLELVNEVKCRLHLNLNVLSWVLPVLAEECGSACQLGLIFFLHQVQCAACVGIRGATTSPSVLPLFFKRWCLTSTFLKMQVLCLNFIGLFFLFASFSPLLPSAAYQ